MINRFQILAFTVTCASLRIETGGFNISLIFISKWMKLLFHYQEEIIKHQRTLHKKLDISLIYFLKNFIQTIWPVVQLQFQHKTEKNIKQLWFNNQ